MQLKVIPKDLVTVTACTKEISEEELFGTLCPGLWSELEKLGEVSSLSTPGGVIISIETTLANKNKVKEKLSHDKLMPYIWQIGDLPLEEFVLQKLRVKNMTLAFAESCTGGLASNMVTNVSGSSEIFNGGIISYTNDVKIKLLGVKQKSIDEHTEVSLAVAKEMAEGVRKKLNTDIGISFTGYAGPLGGTPENPVGTVCIGFANENFSDAIKYHFTGTRSFLKEKFAIFGFYKILDLLNLP